MDHLDVVIVGAGLSGVGAACQLRALCPGKTVAILESRHALGGTWDLFRYPGIRSDSDMHTLGYRFKPWTARKAIADGPAIREYIEETAVEHDVLPLVRFHHALREASWSSEEARWTLEVERTDTGERTRLSCGFLLLCAGYYRYDRGHEPDFVEAERFGGRVVHPQHWPEDLDYAGRRVVVIGSGATAMTLVPAMAKDAAHVTMVQRSPTWVVSRPDVDRIARALGYVLPAKWAYAITRWKNVSLQRLLYERTRTRPEQVRERLLGMVRAALGPDYDVEKHFTPRYDPWDQRLCLIPNGDLYEAIREGRASVETDGIERFTERGLRLASGREIEADVIVTATGLELEVLGGVRFAVDGKPVDFAETWSYKGMMFSGVPNLVQTFGYINASWTLRADLTAEWVCRVLRRMDEVGASQATPRLRDSDRDMPARPWIEDFTPGYMQRAMHRFPKQGDREPWLNTQSYASDRKLLRKGPIEDGVLVLEPKALTPS
ncbi:MAG: NAD(P)/FAD-dependent oxidoreductase [Spirochaetaceae bacterium]|nr:NAD(P)/FAD-dependent oxidoreductase [Myxococcales bacterium]MCB9725582.1 NAD(P)/FAD-dependent oxidoreductase [Spirochaetaceae bacterium]